MAAASPPVYPPFEPAAPALACADAGTGLPAKVCIATVVARTRSEFSRSVGDVGWPWVPPFSTPPLPPLLSLRRVADLRRAQLSTKCLPASKLERKLKLERTSALEQTSTLERTSTLEQTSKLRLAREGLPPGEDTSDRKSPCAPAKGLRPEGYRPEGYCSEG